MADEYYTSPEIFDGDSPVRPEPWEPNVTAMHDSTRLKWNDKVGPRTTLPTTWPKEKFEAYQKVNQAERAQLRKDRRPEAEMKALFKQEQAFVDGLFSKSPKVNDIGAFEGANYQAQGYYRSAMNCMMFTRTDFFCDVCRAGIEDVIRLSTGD